MQHWLVGWKVGRLNEKGITWAAGVPAVAGPTVHCSTVMKIAWMCDPRVAGVAAAPAAPSSPRARRTPPSAGVAGACHDLVVVASGPGRIAAYKLRSPSASHVAREAGCCAVPST